VPSQYAFLGIFLLVALALPVIGLILAWFLRPKKPNPIKNATYECGMETFGDTWVQFKAQYYIFAYFRRLRCRGRLHLPAVAYNKLGLYALVEMVLFILICWAGLSMPGGRMLWSGNPAI
jgi:NADH-quinone oxidoreductase subunit A